MKTPLPGITVGIPTYNRADAVSETVGNFLESLSVGDDSVDADVRVMVSDNASDDATLDRLRALSLTSLKIGQANTRLRILENASNAGFQGNLLRLLDACETEYLLVWSDEDDLSAAAVRAVQRALKSRRIAFASTQFFMGERMYRGRRRGRTIRPSESDAAAFYLSGLIVSVEAFREHREIFVSSGCFSDQSLYPQVEVLQGLLSFGCLARWLPIRIGSKRAQLPSRIEMADGTAYYSVAGRVEQAKRAERWFTVLESETLDDLGQRVVRRLSRQASRELINRLSHALAHEDSELLKWSAHEIRTLLMLNPRRLWQKIVSKYF